MYKRFVLLKTFLSTFVKPHNVIMYQSVQILIFYIKYILYLYKKVIVAVTVTV
jgi:hypothetical protein